MTLLQDWLDQDFDDERKKYLQDLSQSDPAKFDKLMQPRISFGTAGLRAEMGPGFALMNTLTVCQASQGLAKYVLQNVNNSKQRGVVIGHDHRHLSREFALEVVKAFYHLGFKIHFLGLVHTPMVPFGIGKLNASCGVMITASHNPAKDNGYKVYYENGCQIIPPHDHLIAEEILRNLNPWMGALPALEVVDLMDSYMHDVILPLRVSPSPDNKLKVVYTPMHGVGLKPALKIFKALDLEPIIVKEQAQPDPDFPTVAFPNPEEAGAMDLAIEYGKKLNADLIVSNDPDADRFSCCVRKPNSSDFVQLTGDQIGTLFTQYCLQVNSNSNRKLAVVNSTVSSKQMAAQAKLFNADYYETLTGFKWIGNKVIDLTKTGVVVPFAYEEAIGYMLSSTIRDKDGISALLVFLQLFMKLQLENQTCLSKLDKISNQTGFFATHNGYYKCPPSRTVEVFREIRASDLTNIKDLKVTNFRDLTTGYDTSTLDHKPLLPTSKDTEMITVDVERNWTARFTIRGSGTEPKLKVYIEARGSSETEAKNAAKYVWDVLKESWFKSL